jgi:hypothetical protein
MSPVLRRGVLVLVLVLGGIRSADAQPSAAWSDLVQVITASSNMEDADAELLRATRLPS